MDFDYFSNVINIRDKNTNVVVAKDRYSIQKIASPYSNTKCPIFKLVVDTTPISRNNSYVVRYKCQTCDSEKEITLNLYMRKVNKSITRCDACKNTNEDKRKTHSEFMKYNALDIIAGKYHSQSTNSIKERTLKQHLEVSLGDWEKEDDDFKEQYNMRHLTVEDFERIRDRIISINNEKYTNIAEWTYFPTYRIYNQARFTPMLVHKTETCVEKPRYMKFKCDQCDSEFIHRDLECVKNHHKILCQTCSLTNRTFRLRRKTLKDGNVVMWQSVPERRFIEWCEDNGILIRNGPKIEYMFRDAPHTYRVDFELPERGMLIEIKDNNCWHKEQLLTGKFKAKEMAAEEWCKQHNYTYHVIFPKTLQNFKKSILQSL